VTIPWYGDCKEALKAAGGAKTGNFVSLRSGLEKAFRIGSRAPLRAAAFGGLRQESEAHKWVFLGDANEC